MSRMPKREDSAFNTLIRRWMWEQSQPPRPTMTAAAFADLLGVARTTVIHWLNSSAVPQPATLYTIAQKTAEYAKAQDIGRGIRLSDLFAAAGYALPDAHGAHLRDEKVAVIDELIEAFESDTQMAEASRQRALSMLREIKAKYDTRGEMSQGQAEPAEQKDCDTYPPAAG